MLVVWNLFLMALAALFEVGGDALIRRGMSHRLLLPIVLGFLILGTYGVVVNLVQLDFSRLLGAYVGWFALISVAFGRLVFSERVSPSTWVGLGVILCGSLIIQFGGAGGGTPTPPARALMPSGEGSRVVSSSSPPRIDDPAD